MDVRNAKDEDLGHVEDMAITIKGGRILYAELDYGGTLGFGHKHLAVPFHSFKREGVTEHSNGHLVLDISRDELDKLPGFDSNSWPVTPDARFLKGEQLTEKVADRSEFRRARYLIGRTARNPQGDSLGRIRDLVINCEAAKVVYVVLGHSKGTFTSEKLFAVPWDACQVRTLTGRPGDECFVIDIANATLDNNAGFNRDSWPNNPDTTLFKTAPQTR